MPALTVGADIKGMRDALTKAQHWVLAFGQGDIMAHIAKIVELINECDRLRPLNSRGEHTEDLHTPECGCPGERVFINGHMLVRQDPVDHQGYGWSCFSCSYQFTSPIMAGNVHFHCKNVAGQVTGPREDS